MAHGVFVDGVWHSEWYDTSANGGRFVPAEPVFRNWVTPDGSAGPSGEGGFAAERGRYQRREQRHGEEREHAEPDGANQLAIDRLQRIEMLRAKKESCV